MVVDDARVQRALWNKHLLTKEQIESAILLAPSLGKSFVDTLIIKNILPEDTLGQVIAEAINVPYITLNKRKISKNVLNYIPEAAAIANNIVPFDKQDNRLLVATTDPANFGIINFIEKQSGLVVVPHFTFENQIRLGLGQYRQDINLEFKKILAELKPIGTDLKRVIEDVPTVKMLDTMMQFAINENASDIHVEAQETNMLIRYRVDGILHDKLVLEKTVQPAIVARIKFLCNLKIDEHRLPQDGRFNFSYLSDRVGVRVSIIPTFFGENVVMRLLPESGKVRTLEDLGFSPANIQRLTTEISRTNGIILMTGPTGSGKTTTLYSLIDMLNTPNVKIATIEDPIEYSVPRIGQTQVNTATGLDFATGLRALLRHDPNIIMVGEIRDQETADISINAALTGHLVLSTLHTNDAPSTLTRLIDLGVQPFLIVATVRLVVAQRLVRRLCPVCNKKLALTQDQIQFLASVTGFNTGELAQKDWRQPQGCDECTNGFRDRFGIHEVFIVTPAIHDLILSRPTQESIRKLAQSEGMYTMLQDGIAKAGAGLTTIDEVLREIGPE